MVNSDIISIKNFYINNSLELAMDYEEQKKNADKIGIGDLYTDDLANSWFSEDIKKFKEMVESGIISVNAYNVFVKIIDNFDNYSENGNNFDSNIWTLDSLKNNKFWEEQRRLANELRKELLK